jgi:hypothetical protein
VVADVGAPPQPRGARPFFFFFARPFFIGPPPPYTGGSRGLPLLLSPPPSQKEQHLNPPPAGRGQNPDLLPPPPPPPLAGAWGKGISVTKAGGGNPPGGTISAKASRAGAWSPKAHVIPPAERPTNRLPPQVRPRSPALGSKTPPLRRGIQPPRPPRPPDLGSPLFFFFFCQDHQTARPPRPPDRQDRFITTSALTPPGYPFYPPRKLAYTPCCLTPCCITCCWGFDRQVETDIWSYSQILLYHIVGTCMA